MFFDIEIGEVVNQTSSASIHCADDSIHFWLGSFMYSFKGWRKDFISFLQDRNLEMAETHDTVFLKEDIGEGMVTIWIRSGTSSFGFSIKKRYVQPLINFLKKVD